MIAAERDLLCGLIALQVGLIDRGQLVAAFQAWARDRAQPLADRLVEAMVALHLKKHGGNADRRLAAPSSRPRRSR
jgi:hypothetical protein